MNKQALKLVGVTKQDYLEWCEQNNKPAYKTSTKEEFFRRISEKKLARDNATGKIVKKKPRRKV